MAACRREPGHAAQHRRVAQVELLADRGTAVAGLEAAEVHHSVHARQAVGGNAGAPGALLDLAADRDQCIGATVERDGRPVQAQRARIVEGADQRGRAAGPRQPAQPVVVGVVDVDHVHALGAHDGPYATEVGHRVDRVAPDLEGEPGQRLEAGLARFLLEAVARDQAEQDVVPAGPQAGEQADHGLGTARPPAIGHEVQHGQRPARAHASSSS